jgi:hypothetical protein
MKKLCVILLLLISACSAPGTTEINRPAGDVSGTRKLMLTTTFDPREGFSIASASYSDGSSTGFGPGVFITCNSTPIVDTRKTTGSSDTIRFITFSTDYNWSYQGPDTSFTIDMPSPGEIQILEPPQDTEIFQFLGDSLNVVYSPTGPCSNLQVLCIGFNDSARVEDTVRPVIRFDPNMGTINPFSLSSLAVFVSGGQGTISIIKVSDSAFSIPSIHSIVVKDSVVSDPIPILWE